jgi:hypothetical protein
MPRRGIVDRHGGRRAPFPTQLRNQRATSKTGDPANLGFTFTGPPAQSAPRSRTTGHSSWFFFKKRGYVHKGLEAYFAVKDWITMDLEKNKKL